MPNSLKRDLVQARAWVAGRRGLNFGPNFVGQAWLFVGYLAMRTFWRLVGSGVSFELRSVTVYSSTT